MSRRWHIAGDSLVEGVGGTFCGAYGGWAQRLVAALPAETITIAGIGGHTSADLAGRLAGELAGGASCVILAVGLNDSRLRPSLGGNEVPLEAFKTNMGALIETAMAAGADLVVIVGLTRVDEARTAPFKEDRFYTNAEIERYDAVLRDVAGAYPRATYLPVPALTDSPAALADGLHPSDQGYDAMLADIRQGLGV